MERLKYDEPTVKSSRRATRATAARLGGVPTRPAGAIAALSLIAACASPRSSSRAAPVPGPARSGPIALTVEHLSEQDSWRLTYRFSRPVHAARFDPRVGDVRAGHWDVAAGFTLDHPGGGAPDVVRRRDGRPFDDVVVTIRAYHVKPEKDYQFLVPYTDGGSLLYTGYLNVTPLRCPSVGVCAPADLAPVEAAGEPDTQVVFAPRATERVVLLGEVRTGRTPWRATSEGTYVYFGSTTPLQTADFTAVIDPGAPSWLTEQTRTLLPRLFSLYAARFGRPLAYRALVFLSYGATPGPKGVDIGGGVLPGLVELDVRLGSELRHDADPELDELTTYNLAHEASHLWNGQMFRPRADGGDATRASNVSDWMPEGSADAFAYRVLFRLGLIDGARFREKLSEQLSLCLFELEGHPLDRMPSPGKAVYHCGAMIASWTEAAVRSRGGDLFSFWKELFDAATDHAYDSALYERTLRRMEPGGRAADGIRRLLDGPVPPSVDDIRREWSALGVETGLTGSPSMDYERFAGNRAMARVLDIDCGHGAATSIHQRAYVVDDAKGCRALRAGVRIDHIGPHDAFRHGSVAYDYVVERCAVGSNVEVGLEGSKETFSVKCTSPERARPPWVQVTTYP